MRTIQENFQAYAERAVPEGTQPEDNAIAKIHFYAGCQTMYNLLIEPEFAGLSEAAREHIKAGLSEELSAYYEELVERLKRAGV